MDTLQIPPISTPLKQVDPNASNGNGAGAGTSDQTAKQWYLFWSQSADLTNSNTTKVDGLVTWGGHGDRPPADTMPDGAMYAESDRSGVLYQNQGGTWHYLAGTMWGTMVPDERPTDLGVDDSGFTYRSTDLPARMFIWSGTGWVETTPDGGTAPPDAVGAVTAVTGAGEIGTRNSNNPDRLEHLTIGFTPVCPVPQSVTYLVSPDNGATWVWIGSQRMQTVGQQLKVDRLAPGQDSTWKIACVAGNLGGDPSPITDAQLTTLYTGVVRSAGFPVAGLFLPGSNLGITATIGSCSNVVSADGFTQYGVIPAMTYTDPVNTTAFFVRITVQNLDSSKHQLTNEQPYGGTQITGGSHTEPALLITYIPNLAYMRYRIYTANRNSQGGGDFADPSTNTLQMVAYNGNPPADHWDVPITIPPFNPIDAGEAFNVTSVMASEIAGAKYQDSEQGLHTVVGVVPVIDHDYSSPRTVTIWFDFDDGKGPVWQGWFSLTAAGQVVRIGDATLGTDGVRKSGDIWVPAHVSQGNWTVYCGANRIDKGTDPTPFAHSSFTVIPVAPCSPTGTTNAQFLNNPGTDPGAGTPIVYSKYDPGVWYWEYYELTWQPPTIAQEPNYWFTLITIQKGHWDGSTWTPAPDAEGRNEDPSGQYLGRVHDEVVLATGTDPTAVAVMRKFGSNPATWQIPPAQNPDFSTNVYRDFRFLIYNVSRLGTDSSGSGGAGTYTLQTACWPGGKSFFILTPQAQAATLDLRASNPATITGPLTGGNGQPLTVTANGITSSYLGAASVTANAMHADAITAANGALAANSVVDPKIVSLGINKVTYGTSIFAGDVVLSRGIGLPVMVLANTGLTLFGQADASTGATGLTSHPYVQIQASGVKLNTGGGASTLLDAGTNTIFLYSKDGDTTFPYVSIATNGLTMVNGPNSVAINTNAMSFTDTQFHNQLTMNSAGLTVANTSTNNKLVITSSQIQLQMGGQSRITLDASAGITVSNGGAASVVITASTVTITNGAFSLVSGTVTINIDGTNLIKVANSATSNNCVINGDNYRINGASNRYATLTLAQLDIRDASLNEVTLNPQGLSFSVAGAAFQTVIDPNLLWRKGVQCTDHVIGNDFGIAGVSFGWPQTASSGTPVPPGGYGPGAPQGVTQSFATGAGKTVYVCGGLIVNVV